MIKAVAFDWGGVLIDNPTPGLAAYAGKVLGVSADTALDAFQKYTHDFQCGKIEERDIWSDLCARLGVPVPDRPSLYREAVEHVFATRPAVLDLAAKLQASGIKTGFLSNTEVPAMEYFKERHYACFDVTVFSCAEGYAKPDREIYKILLERLGTEPGETVFIDDREDYLAGAIETGIRGIQYKTFEQVAGDLKALGLSI